MTGPRMTSTPGDQILQSVRASSRTGKENLNSSTHNSSKRGQKIKKRLFADDEPTPTATQQKNIHAANLISSAIGIPINSFATSETVSCKPKGGGGTVPGLKMMTPKSVNYPIIDNFNLTAPSWKNFQLDKERLLRALRGQPL